jgi:hypothetical protein
MLSPTAGTARGELVKESGMDENIEPTGSTGMDRRTLIKRAGIVGAGVAVWSAPSVTSLASRAYAAGSVSTSCKSCGSFALCNPNGGDPSLGGCFCFERQRSGCVCGANTLCSDAQACSSQADCPSDYTCIKNNGCGTAVCVPDCSNTTGANNSGGHGLTATGVTY